MNQRKTHAEAPRSESRSQTPRGLAPSAKTESNLTVQLTNDHRAIARDIRRLKIHARKLDPNHTFSETMDFARLAESINEHFKKEEELLFPLLDHSLGSNICDRLKNEHTEIINITSKIGLQTHPVEEPLIHLEQLFRAHISTEENVLFWYLDVQAKRMKATVASA